MLDTKLKKNAWLLIVSSVKRLKRIVHLINGEVRTPKINQVYRLIDWLNSNHNSNINKLFIKNKPLLEDSSLSGFLDADGNFSIQQTKLENNANKRKISCKLKVEHKMLDQITNDSYL